MFSNGTNQRLQNIEGNTLFVFGEEVVALLPALVHGGENVVVDTVGLLCQDTGAHADEVAFLEERNQLRPRRVLVLPAVSTVHNEVLEADVPLLADRVYGPRHFPTSRAMESNQTDFIAGAEDYRQTFTLASRLPQPAKSCLVTFHLLSTLVNVLDGALAVRQGLVDPL